MGNIRLTTEINNFLISRNANQSSLALSELGVGTAAFADTGINAGNVIELDSDGKLPAVDGSNLTGLDVLFPSESLQWDSQGNTQVLSAYSEDGNISTVRSVAITNGQLTLTLATFTPTITAIALPATTLKWDVSATGFKVNVNNPSDILNQYISSVASVTETIGNISNLGLFIQGEKYPNDSSTTFVNPGGGVDWIQSFTANGDTSYIRPISTNLIGGTATGVVTFYVINANNETLYGPTASFSFTWETPNLSVSVNPLRDKTFLDSYSSTTYVVSVTGINSAANYTVSHTAVNTNNVTVASVSKNGGTINFTAPIHKDNATLARTIKVEANFTRPASVTGQLYSIGAFVTTLNPSVEFKYPSLLLFTSSETTIPILTDFVNGAVFKAGVEALGDQTRIVSLRSITLNETKCLWFAVKATITPPTLFQTGTATLLNSVSFVTASVNLRPTTLPSGYIPVGYNLYGITLQPGTTYISIS